MISEVRAIALAIFSVTIAYLHPHIAIASSQYLAEVDLRAIRDLNPAFAPLTFRRLKYAEPADIFNLVALPIAIKLHTQFSKIRDGKIHWASSQS
jgi:hypothetical protein